MFVAVLARLTDIEERAVLASVRDRFGDFFKGAERPLSL